MSKRIEMFKERYSGERCFIIGNGPSLRMEDLDVLAYNKEYSFGANRIYVSFNDTVWRPTFYCIQDGTMIKEYHKEIEKLDLKYKFISDYALEKLGDKSFKTAYMFHLNPHRYYPYYPGFSDDIAQEISEGFTVTYAEIQIAAYMGFKEIYLLGVDFNYSKILDSSGKIVETGSKDYFSDRYILANEKRNIPQLHNSLQAYKKAEVYSKRNGFRIFNATRGGKLEVFERVNFDMLFPLEGDGEI